MACRGLRFLLVIFFVGVFALLSGGVFLTGAFGQKPERETPHSRKSGASVAGASPVFPTKRASRQERGEENGGDRPYLRDDLGWNWTQRGRSVPGGKSAAELRFRAYQQKVAMRAWHAAAYPAAASSTFPPLAKNARSGAPSGTGMDAASGAGSSPTPWVPLGPAPLASDATGDGMQDYNWVSGRATSVLIDPADTSGNTVLLGGAYGGLWKSTNAGSLSSNPASVTWQIGRAHV